MKVLLWNLQDFFLFMDKYQGEDLDQLTEPKWQLLSTSFIPNKPLDKILAITDLIQKQNPDVCLFTEVGGKESLHNFSKYFLKDSYLPYHFKTNSDRGIDLGILVKKELHHMSHVKMHKDSVFARGVMELKLNLPGEGHKFCFLLTHLKSKLNKDGLDFEGRGRREREVLKLIEIYKKIAKSSKYHIFIAGDLNGIIHEDSGEEELKHFATKLGLKDVFEHLNRPDFDRATYLYYNKQNDVIPMQLDYFLTCLKGGAVLESTTQVLDFDGEARVSLPADLAQKHKLPSDHYPIVMDLKLT